MPEDNSIRVRPTEISDIPSLQKVLDGTKLFPSDLLPDMIDGFLSEEPADDLWYTAEQNNEVVGFCYAAPEELTDGTWNMLAIAILPATQGSGVGRELVRVLEADLQNKGHRVLIADTSGTDAFAKTREFYRKVGYTEEARIRGFWGAGDDKVVFWKNISKE